MQLIDLHNDAVTKLSAAKFKSYICGAANEDLKAILVSVWTTRMKNPLKRIVRCKKLIDGLQTPVKLFLHIEDAWFINEQNIDEIVKLKPFSVGLTWNANNALAGGAHGDGGLTKLGRAVAQKLIENGTLIDLAHLNKQSFMEVARLQGHRKLFCSHTCFGEVNPHARNLDREQVQTIVESGGLIGLTLVGEFLKRNEISVQNSINNNKSHAALEDVYAHIKYFAENFGEDNIAIGTDFYGTDSLPEGLKNYADFDGFAEFLLNKGLSAVTIKKIFCDNAERILQI